MPGVSICLLRTIVATWEPNLRRYNVQLRVTMDSTTDGPGVVLQYLATNGYRVGTSTYNLQPLGASATEADGFAILKSIGSPRRAANDTSKLMWIVDLQYEFDLESYPPLRPYSVEPYYIEEVAPIESARYKGAYNRVDGQWVPKQIANPTYTENRTYPIGNSANVPLIPAPEQKLARPAYRVSWLRSTALDASFYINTWNAGLFALDSVSVLYDSPTSFRLAPKFRKTFQPYTLKLVSVQQPIRTIYGIDWYDVTLEFVEEDSDTYELDRGLSAIAKAGAPDGRDGIYSEGDFPEGATGQRALLDSNGQPVDDPVLLDGKGQPLREQSTTTPAIYLRWTKGDGTFFNELQIGAWQ